MARRARYPKRPNQSGGYYIILRKPQQLPLAERSRIYTERSRSSQNPTTNLRLLILAYGGNVPFDYFDSAQYKFAQGTSLGLGLELLLNPNSGYLQQFENGWLQPLILKPNLDKHFKGCNASYLNANSCRIAFRIAT